MLFAVTPISTFYTYFELSLFEWPFGLVKSSTFKIKTKTQK